MMKYVFCCQGPTETCLRVVVLSNFHFVPSVRPTKAACESAEWADGADGISGRRQFCETAAVTQQQGGGGSYELVCAPFSSPQETYKYYHGFFFKKKFKKKVNFKKLHFKSHTENCNYPHIQDNKRLQSQNKQFCDGNSSVLVCISAVWVDSIQSTLPVRLCFRRLIIFVDNC